LGIFKHIKDWRSSRKTSSKLVKPPVLEVLEPRILLSGDGLLSIAPPEPLCDPLLNGMEQTLQYVELLETNEQVEEQFPSAEQENCQKLDSSDTGDADVYQPSITLFESDNNSENAASPEGLDEAFGLEIAPGKNGIDEFLSRFDNLPEAAKDDPKDFAFGPEVASMRAPDQVLDSSNSEGNIENEVAATEVVDIILEEPETNSFVVMSGDDYLPICVNDGEISVDESLSIEIRGPPSGEIGLDNTTSTCLESERQEVDAANLSEDDIEVQLSGTPSLPGLYLVDPTVDYFDGQIIYLDFDGEQDVTYNGPVVIEGINIPEFTAESAGLGGQESEIISQILSALEQKFDGMGVQFTVSKPDSGTSYSTVFVGGDDSVFSEYGSFVGLAEHVDVGNQHPYDKAFVFSESIVSGRSEIDSLTTDLANAIAHETGHLLGYAHEYKDSSSVLSSVALAVSGHITEDTVWDNTSEAYVLDGALYVDAGATLTLSPGVTLRAYSQNDILIDGCLEATGATIELPNSYWHWYYGFLGTEIVVHNGGQLVLSGCQVTGPGRIMVEGGAQADLTDITFVSNAEVHYLSGSAGTVSNGSGSWSLYINSDAISVAGCTLATLGLPVSATVTDSTIGSVTISGGSPVLTGNTIGYMTITGGTTLTATGNTLTDGVPLRITEPDVDISGIAGNSYAASDPWVYIQGTLDNSKLLPIIDGVLGQYELSGSLTIGAGATLTLSPGVTLRAYSQYDILIGGCLEATGATIELPNSYWHWYYGFLGTEIVVHNGGQLVLSGCQVTGPGRIMVEGGAQADLTDITFVSNAEVHYLSGSAGTVSNGSGSWSLYINSDAISVAGCTLATLGLPVSATVTDSTIGSVTISGGSPVLTGNTIGYMTITGGTTLTATGNTLTDGVPLRITEPDVDISGIAGNSYAASDPWVYIQGTLDNSKLLPIIDGVLGQYELSGSLTIGAGATLTLSPGVTLRAYSQYDILIGGCLEATGATIELPNSYWHWYYGFLGTEIVVHNGGQLVLSGCQVTGPGRIMVEDGAQAELTDITFVSNAEVHYLSGSGGTVRWCTLNILSVHSSARVLVDNNDFSQGSVSVSGDAAAVVNMENNWWGTTDEAQIEGKITHHVDNPTLPWVDYMPWRVSSPLNFYVSGQHPLGRVNQENNYILIIFNSEVDLSGFTPEDILLMGPSGLVAATSIETSGIGALGSATYRVSFAQALTAGTYRVRVGPNILNLAGYGLDQDGDGVGGEPIEDIYEGAFVVDMTGPRIVNHSPIGDVGGSVDHVDVWFSEKMISGTFTVKDVSIASPGGIVPATGVSEIGNNVFRVSFSPQSIAGIYNVVIGPDIMDLAGNVMDQNRSGIQGEATDDTYDAWFHLVDVDLTVANVSVSPAELWAGEQATVSWDGTNNSGLTLLGDWTDAVYFSTDDQWDINDVRLATVTHTGGLDQGEVYHQSAEVVVPGALPGQYYIIVRADLYNQEKEAASECNNIVVVGPISLNIHELLTDGVPIEGTLTTMDRTDYYAIHVETGQNLLLVLDNPDAGDMLKCFVSYEKIPTRLTYDYQSVTSFRGKQQVIVPVTLAGTYYVLVYGDQLSEPAAYTLTASLPGLVVTGLSPDHHGVESACTITLTGAGFDSMTMIEFVGSDGSVWTPTETQLISPATMTAVLDVPTWPADVYDLIVSTPGVSPFEIADAFEVLSGIPNLEVRVVLPEEGLGRLWLSTIWIEYKNTGNSSMPAPLLTLHGTDNAILTLDPLLARNEVWTDTFPPGTSDTVEFMIRGSGATPGILQPGESGRIPVYYLGLKQPWDFSDGSVEFQCGGLTADDTTPIDWASLKDQMRPDYVRPDAWDAVWANFTAQVGNTWGDYLSMLAENANFLGSLGCLDDTHWILYTAVDDVNIDPLVLPPPRPSVITDMTKLLAFEFRQADGLSPIAYLAQNVDTVVTAPGLPIVFSRAYAQPISRRFELGTLGRGWTHNWQYLLTVASDGAVTITDMTGTPRIFKPDTAHPGAYIASTGDYGTLTRVGDAFRLQEPDGTFLVFRSDGKLDYISDTNSNSIMCGYTGDFLTSLTHSSGQVLLISYNASGRIDHITDPDGRETLFMYDESGEHLMSVRDYDGRITSYTYSIGLGLTCEHALTQIIYPGGIHQYFVYDPQGRLSEIYRDGGAERVAFTYNSTGKVTATDDLGNPAQFYFDDWGRIVKTQDALGNAVYLAFDKQGNLARVTDPPGRLWQYAYDNHGNVVASADPMRHIMHFTYTGSFNRLASIIDANGNLTRYSYDASGNLTSITYADGSQEYWSYDSLGNPTTWTNRRGNPISYTYGVDGRITQKTYADGSYVDYTYDARGNLILATDTTGTTIYTYDANDYLTRIDYPGGQWLEFTYDAAGRRASSLDQLGHRLEYRYDVVGRLSSMIDETGTQIVLHEYDAVGRLSRKTVGNGVYTTYDYDASGQLLHLVNYAPDVSVLSRFDYTYDSRGRRTSMNTSYGLWTYEYDNLGQLTHAVLDSTDPDIPDQDLMYVYDALGNRIRTIENGVTMEYTTNNLNQYTQVDDTTYVFDADGNLIQEISPDVTTTYAYNDENRLIAVSRGTDTWHYTYDALGNRVTTTENGVTTQYVIDPIGLGNVVGEYDASGNLIANYDCGFGLLSRTAGSASAYYVFDAIGNVQQLVTSAGAVANAYAYAPFGTLLQSSEALSSTFQFVGEYGVMQEPYGLDYMRARYYSPRNGGFLSVDPLWVINGDVNKYVYSGNSPLDFADPAGLCRVRQLLVGIVQAIGGGISIGGAIVAAGGTLGTLAFPAVVATGWGIYQVISGLQNIVAAIRGQSFPGTGGPIGDIGKLFFEETGGRVGSTADLIVGVRGTGTIFTWFGNTLSSRIPFALGFLRKGWFCGWSQNPGPMPSPHSTPITTVTGSVARIWDPNSKLAPSGYADAHFLPVDSLLPYTIHFENEADATAPAHIVRVMDTLDEDLDLSTFELTEIAFANQFIVVPSGLNHYETTMNLVIDNEFISQAELFIQIDVSLDINSRELTFNMIGLDPNTGWLPEDIMLGILYPNDATGRGEGHISYIVRPKAGLASGTEITNRASIVFDWNDPIDTPLVLNTIDAGLPTSQVQPLPGVVNEILVPVSWTGLDEEGGSGIHCYDIYVSDNGGLFTLWLDDTTETSTTFVGEDQHTYAFYSIATDNVGHRESAPGIPDSTITILLNRPPIADAGGPYYVTEGGSILLDASGTTDPDLPGDVLTYEWDFDGDGQYDDATGINPIFSAALLDGPTSVTVGLKVTDSYGESNTDTAEINVTNVAPDVQVSITTQDVQYSDPIDEIRITATDILADEMNPSMSYSTDGGATFLPGLPDALSIPGGLVLSGSPDQAGTGIWTLTGIADLAPRTYIIRVTVSDEEGGSSSADTTFVVTKEDAAVTYSGPQAVSTRSTKDRVAIVELRAVVQDITGIDLTSDPQAGNITRATVSFIDRGTGAVIAEGVPVELLASGDGWTGVAKYDWQVDFGDSASMTFTVGIIVEGFYTRNSPADNTIVTVSKVVTTNEVTGDGWLINRNSAGLYAGDADLRTDFVFQAKYNKQKDSLQGNLRMMIRSASRVYEIRSDYVESLAVSSDKSTAIATVIFRVTLFDITNRKNPITIANNLSIVITLTSVKTPVSRSMGVTLWRGNQLLFSSCWSGTKTTEQLIDGGSITIQ